MIRYLVFAICAALVFILLSRYMVVARFLAEKVGDEIYENIYINGVAVGGMMRAEAEETLKKAAELDRKVIGFVYNNSLIYSWTFVDFGAEYDFSDLVEEAYLYGREGTRRERYNILKALGNQSHNITGDPRFRYDEALIPTRLDVVRSQASVLAVNASMRLEYRQSGRGLDNELLESYPESSLESNLESSLESNLESNLESHQFIITEGIPGRTPDIQLAAEQLRQILASRQPGQVELEMYIQQPNYNTHDFLKAQSLIGSFYTEYFGIEETHRNINIRLAASLINNTVVYPGQVFSTREAVGPSTPERGYEPAAVIVDGHLVEDYGGGVCQVVSTLYNAVLFAELPVIERANHSLRVHYLDFGFDAAIAGDYMDLKFKNNLEYPILVVAEAKERTIEVRIYGNETRPANRTLAFVSELVDVIPPEPERVLIDENLPSGHVLVNTQPQNGYKYELFRIVFLDGEQVERERVNVSVYRPIQGVITRGP